MTHEERMDRLEQIVGELETDSLPLDGALRLFEEGVQLLRTASEDLSAVEGRVQMLVERAAGVFEVRDTDE